MSKSCRDMSQFERLSRLYRQMATPKLPNLGGARRRTQKGRDRLSQEDGHTQLRILAEIRVSENAKQSGNQFWREVCIS